MNVVSRRRKIAFTLRSNNDFEVFHIFTEQPSRHVMGSIITAITEGPLARQTGKRGPKRRLLKIVIFPMGVSSR